MEILGVGAIDEHHPVLERIQYWHGTLNAVLNWENVPPHDLTLQSRGVYEQGEHLRGSKSSTAKGNTRPQLIRN